MHNSKPNHPQKYHGDIFDAKPIRQAVRDAMSSVEDAKQKCLAAGQMLNEVQSALPHGQFQQWIESHIPELPYPTAARWARAAANIAKALPMPAIEVEGRVISVSDVLATPDESLSPAARKYKQAWFEFTADKTIKQCLAGVFVEGDEAHRVDRAVNGKTARGAGGSGDRKEFEKFTALKLRHITTFVNKRLAPAQQAAISGSFVAAMQSWPRWLVAAIADQAKQELKLSDAERAAR